MKYFIDTEFLEGQQSTVFGSKTKPTIDLISIGIVSLDGREYYAVSKDFNLNEAWNRFQDYPNPEMAGNDKRYFWLRENVLIPIFFELALTDFHNTHFKDEWYKDQAPVTLEVFSDNKIWSNDFKWFKRLIEKYGKTNQQIAKEIKQFCFPNKALNRHNNEIYRDSGGTEPKPTDIVDTVEFYGYYSSYDWVVFCWIFGKMIDLPKGFPKYCRDLKQIMDEKGLDGEWKKLNCPDPIGEHNALVDAKWNLKLFNLLNK